MSLQSVIKNVSKFATDNSTTILTGLAVTGVFGTVTMGIKATPKALNLIELEKERQGVDQLSKKDIIKTTWQCYITTAVMGTATVVCIIGANNINLRKNAAIASAYSLTETALKEYQQQVIEEVGVKKETTIRDNVAKNKITENPVQNNEVYMTGKGETLCYDSLSGRYFKSDIERVKQSVNVLNSRLIERDSVPLNDLYYEIGLEETVLGDELGWDGTDGLIDIHYSAQLSTTGDPCLVIDHRLRPKMDYM